MEGYVLLTQSDGYLMVASSYPSPPIMNFLAAPLMTYVLPLKSSVKKNILPPEGTRSRKKLLGINTIFKNIDLHDPPTKPPTPTGVPRVEFQSKDPTIIPRVQLHSNHTTRFLTLPIRQTEMEMGHPQVPIPLKSNNKFAHGILTGVLKQKKS